MRIYKFHAFSLLILAFVLIAIFGPPLIMGRSLWVTSYTDFSEGGPAHLLTPDWMTFAFYEFPFRKFAHDEILAGRFPLWNPYQSLGLPLAAQLEIRLFSPLQLLEILLPPSIWGWVHLAKMFFAGAIVYAFLIRLRCGLLPAIIGAIFYALSAPLVLQTGLIEYIDSAVFAPLLFYATDKAATPGPWQRRVVLVALATFCIIVSGQPQIAILLISAAGLYFLVRAALYGGAGFRAAATFVAGMALGVGLASCQLIIFYELVVNAFSSHVEGIWNRGALPFDYLAIIFPYLFGQIHKPITPEVGRKMIWQLSLGWVGVFGLWALLAGVISAIRDLIRCPSSITERTVVVLGMSLLLIVCALKAIGSSWINALGNFKLFTYIQATRYMMPILSIAAAVIVGIALRELRQRSKTVAILASAVFIVIVCSVMFIVIGVLTTDTTNRDYAYVSVGLVLLPALVEIAVGTALVAYLIWGRITYSRFALAVLILLTAELSTYVRLGFPVPWEAARAAVSIALSGIACFAGLSGVGVGGRSVIAALILLAVANGTWLSMSGHGLPALTVLTKPLDEDELFIRDNLKPGMGRVLATTSALRPNKATAIAVADIATQGPFQLKPSAALLRAALKNHDEIDPNYWVGVDCRQGAQAISWNDYVQDRKLLNMAGVRWLISKKGDGSPELADLGFRKIYSGSSLSIYEDEGAFPRAWAVQTVQLIEPVRSQKEIAVNALPAALLATNLDTLDWRRTALAEETDVSPSRNLALLARSDLMNTPQLKSVPIIRYVSNEVIMKPNLDRLSMVVLSDAWYPGWRAEIDGRPVDTYRVNVAMRGVIVEPGQHEVRWSYEPSSFKLGLIVSGVSLGFLCLLCLVAFSRPNCSTRFPPN